MLLLQGSSETGLFRHLSDYVFGVRNIEIKKCIRVIFFFKIFKFILDFKYAEKTEKKINVSDIFASDFVS